MITKEAICNAALKLAAKKDIDKITIREITDECHITRQAFYYHFQDVTDMIEWAMQQEISRLAVKNKDCRSLEEVLCHYCESFIINRKTIVFKVLNSSGYGNAVQKLVESLKVYLLKLLDYSQMESGISVKDGNFLLDYHAWAITAMFLKWSREKDADIENGIRQIVRIMRGDMHI